MIKIEKKLDRIDNFIINYDCNIKENVKGILLFINSSYSGYNLDYYLYNNLEEMLNENYCDNLEDFKNKKDEFEIYEIRGKRLNIKDLKTLKN